MFLRLITIAVLLLGTLPGAHANEPCKLLHGETVCRFAVGSIVQITRVNEQGGVLSYWLENRDRKQSESAQDFAAFAGAALRILNSRSISEERARIFERLIGGTQAAKPSFVDWGKYRLAMVVHGNSLVLYAMRPDAPARLRPLANAGMPSISD